MTVETLARKLQPLEPTMVAQWRSARLGADTNFKLLLDRELVRLAQQRLGDIDQMLLLSLPPKNKARGTFNLGTVLYEQDKWSLGISASELLQNMAVFGRSGAGKTNVVFHVLKQLADKKIPFLFLDWKRTGRHLLPLFRKKVAVYTPGRSLSPFPFNPFVVPPGLEPNVYVNHVIDVLADAYVLGEGSKSILQKALAALYEAGEQSPTVEALLKEVEHVHGHERIRGWKISATRALESVRFSRIMTQDSTAQLRFAQGLLQQSTIVELDALSQSTKKFLIPILALWLFYVKLVEHSREQLNFVIVVEEAHHVLHGDGQRFREPVLSMLLRQCRELGMAMIVVDQHPHLISSAVLGNSYTSICLNLKDPRDVTKAAAISAVQDVDKHWIGKLPVGQGVVKLQDRWREPILVRFPLVGVKKGAVTDQLLQSFLSGSVTLSGLRQAVEADRASKRRFRVGDSVLDNDGFALIKDVLSHRSSGVWERYQRLGWSGDKGNRNTNRLVRAGVLESSEITIGRTRKRVLRVSVDAKKELGLTTEHARRESLEHEYWKRFWADHFRRQGYQVQLEAPRPNGRGRVDVLATKASETVAIEIETGKSDAVWNVKQDLLSDFGNVVVVTTDQRAFKTVDAQLALTGLLIPPRVTLVFKDQFFAG